MRAPVIPADPVEAFRLFLRVAGRPANKHTGDPRGKPTHPRIYHAMLNDGPWRAWLGLPEFSEHYEECTGFTAQWCQKCGTCACPDQEKRGVDIEPSCPLHRADTAHDGGWSNDA